MPSMTRIATPADVPALVRIINDELIALMGELRLLARAPDGP